MLHKRLLAAATATFLALGMAVGGASPAMAAKPGDAGKPVSSSTPVVTGAVTTIDDNGLTCDKVDGYSKPDSMNASSGTYTAQAPDAWGSVSWDGSVFSWSLNSGWDVDFCVKGGTKVVLIDTSEFDGTSYDFKSATGNGISHVGFDIIGFTLPLVAASTSSTPENCLDGNGSITFAGDEGVTYTVEGIDGTFEPGDVLDGLNAGEYEITAIAPSGYGIDGDASFTETVGSTSIDCELPLVEASTSSTPENCLDGNGSITFAGDEGVTYTVEGIDGTFEPGDVLDGLNAGEYEITAIAPSGYGIGGDASFTETVGSTSILCTLPLVEASTSSSPENCLDGNGSITFIGDEGVTFTVEGIDGTFEPGDELDGLNAGDYEITASAPSGYGIDGDATFTETVGSTSVDCPVEPLDATASADPTPTNCLDGNGSITFGDDAGVTYTVEGIEGEFGPGDTIDNLTAGEYAITATADEGYELTNSGEFSVEVEFEFVDCEPPTFGTASVTFDWTAPTCELPGAVSINEELTSNAVLIEPEFEMAAMSEQTFTFRAAVDSVFSASEGPFLIPATGPGAPTIISTEITEEGTLLTVVISIPAKIVDTVLCGDLTTKPLTEGSVTFTQPDCLGNPGSFTLSNEPGVVWTVDGVVVEGNKTYTAAAGSTPTIVASLVDSEEFGFQPGQQTVWNLSFIAPTNCDLTTLAITGASNALSGLGMVAILIMMAGTGLVVARRREAARIQG